MNEFDKDLQYLQGMLQKSYSLEQLNQTKRTWKHFLDKWSIMLSPTDPRFLQVKQSFQKDMDKKYTELGKAYL